MNRLATIALPVALATAAVLGFNSVEADPSEAQRKSIVDVAVSTGSHNTLVAAVKAAVGDRKWECAGPVRRVACTAGRGGSTA